MTAQKHDFDGAIKFLKEHCIYFMPEAHIGKSYTKDVPWAIEGTIEFALRLAKRLTREPSEGMIKCAANCKKTHDGERMRLKEVLSLEFQAMTAQLIREVEESQ